jgi:hypothetical protein
VKEAHADGSSAPKKRRNSVAENGARASRKYALSTQLEDEGGEGGEGREGRESGEVVGAPPRRARYGSVNGEGCEGGEGTGAPLRRDRRGSVGGARHSGRHTIDGDETACESDEHSVMSDVEAQLTLSDVLASSSGAALLFRWVANVLVHGCAIAELEAVAKAKIDAAHAYATAASKAEIALKKEVRAARQAAETANEEWMVEEAKARLANKHSRGHRVSGDEG